MSKVAAHWDQMGRLVEIAKDMKSESLLFGNGDVWTVKHAHELCEQYGADGWMIGRGIFGNPWLFNTELERDELSFKERLLVMMEHSEVYEELFHDRKNFALMRKHYKSYTINFPEVKTLRAKLMGAQNYTEVKTILRFFI